MLVLILFTYGQAQKTYDRTAKLGHLDVSPVAQKMNAQGGIEGRAVGRADRNIALSPVITFDSDIDGDREIYTMHADGSDRVQLTDNNADDSSPSWSSDGTRIVFTSDVDGDFEIYTINTDGSLLIKLTGNSANDSDPDWSPSTPTTAGDPEIIGIEPNVGEIGETLRVTISGYNTHFGQGSGTTIENIRFTQGRHTIIAESFYPISDGFLQAVISIPQNARVGLWDISVFNEQDGKVTLEDGFSVVAEKKIWNHRY